MSSVVRQEVSLEKISEPADRGIGRVDQDYYAISNRTNGLPHVATYGLDVCKGIAIFNPLSGRGLIAHLASVDNLEESLSRILTAYEEPMEDAVVTLVKTHDSETYGPDTSQYNWHFPDFEDVCRFFEGQNPARLLTDSNLGDLDHRGIALNLHTGEVTDMVRPDLGWSWEQGSEQEFPLALWPSIPINPREL